MAEEINLKVNIESGNGKKTVADVRKELDEAKKSATQTGTALNDGLKKAEGATVSLKAQLRSMIQEMQGLDPSSERFKTLAKQAGELTDKIGDVNERVKSLSSDTKRLDSLVRVGGAIAGGFQAAQGAMALFGANSKEVEKAIQNIIAVQGVMNGVQQVGIFLTTKQNGVSILDTTIKYANAVATKVVTAVQWLWNAALTANPIGLVVVAIAAMGAGIYKLAKGLKDGTITIQDINKVLWRMIMPLQLIVDLYKYLTEELSNNETSLQKNSKASTEAYKKAVAEANERRRIESESFDERQTQFDLNIARLDAEGKSTKALTKIKLEEILSERRAVLEHSEFLINEMVARYEREAALRGKSLDDFLKSIGINKAATQAVLEEQIQAQKDAVFSAETDLIAHSKDTNKAIVSDKELTAEELARIERERLENLQKLEDEFLQQLEDAESDYYDSKLTAQQKEIQDVGDKYFELIETAKQYGLDTTILEDARRAELLLVDEKYKALQLEADEKAAADKKAIDDKADADKKAKDAQDVEDAKVIQDAKFGIAKNVAQATIDLAKTVFELTNRFGKQDEESKLKRAKRQFEINKALAISEATISTINGVVNALAEKSILPSPLSTVVKAINAATVAAAGAANIAKIASSTFSGGASSPSISSGGGDVSASISDLGNKEPQLQAINAGSTFLNQEKTQQVLVVEDVNSMQKKVKAIEGLASFG